MSGKSGAKVLQFRSGKALTAPTSSVSSNRPRAPRKEARGLYWPPAAPRTWSVSIVDLGAAALRFPLTVQIEDYGTEVVASWPEVEAWGSGANEAEAVNHLKDELVALYRDLHRAEITNLGALPTRWRRALLMIVAEESLSAEAHP